MKIRFITSNPNENMGSYRIWVRDLSRTLLETKEDSKILDIRTLINSSIDEHSLHFLNTEIKNADVIIMGKSCYNLNNLTEEIKKLNPNSLLGAININSDYADDNLDFVIVGSWEEYCSLSYYENIFFYPLIEREFENAKIKKHEKSNNLRICYHGHYPHLSKFDPYVKSALEEFSNQYNVTLVTITGNPEFNWEIGKPKGVKIENHDYNINTISDIITTCDIGIVPNVSDVGHYFPQLKNIKDVNRGWNNTDFILRFKNKTNGGRAYVLYQHGIPVIHDLSPNSFDFMSKSGEYTFAHDKLSYKRALNSLVSSKNRNRVALANKNAFFKYFNPHEHAKNLKSFLENLSLKITCKNKSAQEN